MDDKLTVTVKILDKEYLIACRAHEREELLATVHYLSEKMREIRDRGLVLGTERVAVMAALNIAHELLQNGSLREREREQVKARTEAMLQGIERTLAEL